MRTTLIITTFNRPDALALVLRSIQLQTQPPAEIIVADDGSTEETSDLLRLWRPKLPIIHSWLPDRSFRAARSRNLAIARVTGEHTVFIDGDCIIPKQFIESHRNLAEKRKIVTGGRFLMTENATRKFLRGDPHETQFQFPNYKFWQIPCPNYIRDLRTADWKLARTCNMSAMTDDILQVGGFDEAYLGWGREDSDFVVRLINAGCTLRSARFAACVLHLYHPEETRERLSENDGKFQAILNSPSITTPGKSILRNR